MMLRRIPKRGQMTINNFLYILVMLFVVAGLFPLVYQAIDMLLGSTTDPTVKIIISLIPLAIVVGILNTIVAYGQPGGYLGR